MPGKSDWLARGLPTEGKEAGAPRAGSLARDDVITCRLGDQAAEVRRLIEGSPYGFALVTTEDGILLGRLPLSALENTDSADAESVMEPGPSTVRPDVRADELAKRLAQKGLRSAIVTGPDGRLVGVVRTDDLPGH